MTIHNLHYYHDLMRRLREAIEAGTLGEPCSYRHQRLGIPLNDTLPELAEFSELAEFPELAYAAAPAGGSPWTMFLFLGGFALIFYFMIFRPQSKRRKEHAALVSGLSKGDEVVTVGGMTGLDHPGGGRLRKGPHRQQRRGAHAEGVRASVIAEGHAENPG